MHVYYIYYIHIYVNYIEVNIYKVLENNILSCIDYSLRMKKHHNILLLMMGKILGAPCTMMFTSYTQGSGGKSVYLLNDSQTNKTGFSQNRVKMWDNHYSKLNQSLLTVITQSDYQIKHTKTEIFTVTIDKRSHNLIQSKRSLMINQIVAVFHKPWIFPVWGVPHYILHSNTECAQQHTP